MRYYAAGHSLGGGVAAGIAAGIAAAHKSVLRRVNLDGLFIDITWFISE